MSAFGIFLENRENDFPLLWIRHNVAQAVVVDEAERFRTRPFATPEFFFHTALNVFRQPDDIISGASAFDTHKQARVIRHELAGRRANGFDDIVLEQPSHSSFVNRVAIQPVNVPTQNAIGLTAFDSVEHRIENWSARMFRASGFLKGFVNGDSFTLGEGAKFFHLARQTQDLVRLVISGFANVCEVCD